MIGEGWPRGQALRSSHVQLFPNAPCVVALELAEDIGVEREGTAGRRRYRQGQPIDRRSGTSRAHSRRRPVDHADRCRDQRRQTHCRREPLGSGRIRASTPDEARKPPSHLGSVNRRTHYQQLLSRLNSRWRWRRRFAAASAGRTAPAVRTARAMRPSQSTQAPGGRDPTVSSRERGDQRSRRSELTMNRLSVTDRRGQSPSEGKATAIRADPHPRCRGSRLPGPQKEQIREARVSVWPPGTQTVAEKGHAGI